MKELPITAIVVSLEISDKVYGTGNTHFVSLRAEEDKEREDGTPMGLADAMSQSLDMHLRCFESALSAKLSAGSISAADYETGIRKFATRIKKARKYLLEDEPLVKKKEQE